MKERKKERKNEGMMSTQELSASSSSSAAAVSSAAASRPDVRIFDENNHLIDSFNSAHGTTFQDILDAIGPCGLRHVDTNTRIASKSWILAPGDYVAFPKRPRFTETTPDPSDDFRRLQKKLDEIVGQESFAVSYADYFNEKSAAGRVEFWTLPVMNDPMLHLPACLRNDDDLDKGGELSAVRICWKKLIRDNEPLFPGWKTAYEVGYLGSKIPDIAIFPSNVAKPNAGEFVAYGDCKGSNWSGTSASEMGQSMQYGHRILDAQPLRTHAYGFFTNNEIVMIVKTARTTTRPYTISWQISGVMAFDQGMASFYQLLRCDSGFMLPPAVNGKLVSIKRALRPGRTCRAFLSVFDGREGVVAKLFHNELQVQDNRQKILEAKAAVDVQSNSATENSALALVPTIKGSEGRWLLITPFGTTVKPGLLKMKHIQMLVSTLQAVHRAGIVHRDVRFANIFLLEDDDDFVLLNDWGSSARMGAPVEVAGCPDPWRHPELRGMKEYTPHPKHDLYSLVVSVGDLVTTGMGEVFRNSLLEGVVAAANACDYDGVVNGLEKIFL